MKSGLLTSARRWLAALGLAAAVTAPTMTGAAIAAPYVPMPELSAPGVDGNVTLVRDRDGRRWRRHEYRGDGYWRGGRRYGWDGRNHRHYRHGGRNLGGLALGLGVGVPLGAYLASRPAYDYGPYGYYDEGYVVRRVVPRPVYRAYGGNRHVNWCYNRYRSYRAYDNSFQPYNGPRQQCYSPYS